jgi:hypothetical protein
MRKSGDLAMNPQTKKLSRRSFGRLLAVSPLAAAAAAPQAPISRPAPRALSRNDELRAANERRLSTSQALAKFNLPMATEPAFVFRP